MRRSALAAAGVLSLALPPLLLAACPSLGTIGTDGGAPDVTVDHGTVHPTEASADRRAAEAAPDAPCTAKVTSDPKNCGRCGHDCLGGACIDGACQPVILYSGSDTPTSIVVDGPSIFVTVDSTKPTGGYLFKCTTDNCQATMTVLATGLADPWFAVAHGGSVFWDNSGTTDAGTVTGAGAVLSCPETGCPDTGPIVYTPDGGGGEGGSTISGLALDDTYIYWANLYGYTGQTGTILQCAAAECAGTTVQLVGGFDFIPLSVAVDPNWVYWTDLGTNQVLRCALSGCGDNPMIFANGQKGASGLALYGGNVYWTQGIDDGGVLVCPAAGCAAPTTIAHGQANPVAVAVDDSGAYWTNTNDGTVRHCPLGACPEPIVIAETPAAFAIALDPVSVYFTDSSVLGKVLRVAK
jgi:hypothetical protein